MEGIEHQQGFLETFCGHGGHILIVEQVDQGLDVVAADHGAQQFGGLGLGDQSHLEVPVRDSGQEGGLDLGRIVHARGHAVGQQVHQEVFLTGRRVLDQLDQLGHLLGVQGQGRNAEGGAFGNMGSIGLQHGTTPVQGLLRYFMSYIRLGATPFEPQAA